MNILVLSSVLLASWFADTLTVHSAPLDDYIRHYEPLHYDRARLHTSHGRVRRSLDDKVVLKFRAYNRQFEVHLVPDRSIFSKSHKLLHSDGRLEDVDTSHIYKGSLRGVPDSSVHMSIMDGLAQGHIHIPGDTRYHIEPSARFFRNVGFHSVIYAEKHMVMDPYKERREHAHSHGSCGLGAMHKWMKEVSESAVEPPHSSRAKRMAPEQEELSGPHNKYSERANRQKRASLGEANTCYLYMRSDPMLWNHIKQKVNPPLSDERTKEEIIAFFASHVAELKKIYQGTVFKTYDNSQSWTEVDFLVQRSTIMNNVSEGCDTPNPTQFCDPNIDVSNFLNLNSKRNHNEFCLAYVFTYRDFTHGTLGLAWVGSPTRAAGGICERYKEYPEGNANVYKSLNTGIVTIVNYGKTVPARVSQLTFAHEVGHNFGSPHDSGPECVPTSSPGASSGGNYIMYASATMGDKEHNDEFSPCSKDNITRVISAVRANKFNKVACFNKSDAAFCGNSIVEEGEECDCGYLSECQDTCCHAKGSGAALECKLRTGKQCSPTQGPCCSSSCIFITKQQNVQCRPSDDCIMAAHCEGNNATCPESFHQPNMTYCNDHSQVCISGDCIGSVCRRIGWEECYLQSVDNQEGPTREQLCYIACKPPGSTECISSAQTDALNKPGNLPFKELLSNISADTGTAGDLGVQLPPGSPCDNYKGYCDVFHRCRGVDAEGPLARLKNLIFNPETLQTIRDWIVVHWWAVMLMAIALVVVMGLFIKVCAVHTPSSNPNKAPARKLTLPRRHQGQHAAGGGRGQAAPKPQAHASNMPPQRTGYGGSKGNPSRGKKYTPEDPRDIVRPYNDSHQHREWNRYGEEVDDFPNYMGDINRRQQRGAGPDPRFSNYRSSAPIGPHQRNQQIRYNKNRNTAPVQNIQRASRVPASRSANRSSMPLESLQAQQREPVPGSSNAKFRNSTPGLLEPGHGQRDRWEDGPPGYQRDGLSHRDNPSRYGYDRAVPSGRDNRPQEPPPPYSGPNVGGPAHGKGPRYNKGARDKRGAQNLELQRI